MLAVPPPPRQVYVGGKLVGGCDATKALIAYGKFDALLGEAGGAPGGGGAKAAAGGASSLATAMASLATYAFQAGARGGRGLQEAVPGAQRLWRAHTLRPWPSPSAPTVPPQSTTPAAGRSTTTWRTTSAP